MDCGTVKSKCKRTGRECWPRGLRKMLQRRRNSTLNQARGWWRPVSPSSSTKEACLKPVPRDMPQRHGATLSTCCLAGPMQDETPRHFLWNRPFSPEVPMAFVDGESGPWGLETPRSTNPMQASWGWEMCGLTFNTNCDMHSTNNGNLLGLPMLATFGCTAKETTHRDLVLGILVELGLGSWPRHSPRPRVFHSSVGCGTPVARPYTA